MNTRVLALSLTFAALCIIPSELQQTNNSTCSTKVMSAAYCIVQRIKQKINALQLNTASQSEKICFARYIINELLRLLGLMPTTCSGLADVINGLFITTGGLVCTLAQILESLLGGLLGGLLG
ncbi:uncharacterized protein LOC116168264 isoform X1 [Photinus pyralis]|uniref:uncharacterized protein LOC116168264 isoform X1 n=1 Tax=Photinus pyralis TaxID=7054 RepID=UPI0012670345|nr:uncharacterized protein LOC116168264 isoform X1 [Photinus pyralis]